MIAGLLVLVLPRAGVVRSAGNCNGLAQCLGAQSLDVVGGGDRLATAAVLNMVWAARDGAALPGRKNSSAGRSGHLRAGHQGHRSSWITRPARPPFAGHESHRSLAARTGPAGLAGSAPSPPADLVRPERARVSEGHRRESST
jgi:hypothetical protein